MGLRTFKKNYFSAGTEFIRQNMTSTYKFGLRTERVNKTLVECHLLKYMFAAHGLVVWSPNGIFGWNRANRKLLTFFADFCCLICID